MTMGTIKAGQFVSIRGTIYRAKKRDPQQFMSCTGCALNNPIMCPNICYTNAENKTPLNCEIDGLIFVKP